MTTGIEHAPAMQLDFAPGRVVSLLPSMTRNLIDLGAADRLVGVTDYCPLEGLESGAVQRIGGPKNPAVDRILALDPDLILANREENNRQSVEALLDAGIPVWVTFPRTTLQSMEVLWGLVGLLRLESQAANRLHALQMTLDWAFTARETNEQVPTFCPIWQERNGPGELWWMTFNQDTYAHDLLSCCGGGNVFADRKRRYPLAADLGEGEAEEAGSRDERYPRVTFGEVIERQPEVILLPDEPYRFRSADRDLVLEQLSETPAVQNDRVHLVEGALLTWHGTYMANALAELPTYFLFRI